MSEGRRCSKCGEIKLLSAFGHYPQTSRRSLRGKPHYHCRSCKNLARRLKNRGISEAEFFARLKEQQWTCALCPADFHITRPQIDHDHETDFVRGILCNTCNWRLGLLETLPKGWIARAIRYTGNPQLVS